MAKRPTTGCVKTAGKTRQKWQVRIGITFTKLGTCNLGRQDGNTIIRFVMLALSPAVCASTASDCMATPETTNLCSLGICCLVVIAEVSSVVAATILSSSEKDTFGFTPARR